MSIFSVRQCSSAYCSSKESLSSLCESISGDAPLYSMFRKHPRPTPQACPFRPPPFTFTYSRGSGDCANPPSRAESCTDDSRLLLRYMACPDVPGTESNGAPALLLPLSLYFIFEELVCLATWKEGSTRYLVGQITQVQRRNSIVSDEDTYRCFIYKGQHMDKGMTYYIAQSGDATCNGLSSPTDGSRTMRLINNKVTAFDEFRFREIAERLEPETPIFDARPCSRSRRRRTSSLPLPQLDSGAPQVVQSGSPARVPVHHQKRNAQDLKTVLNTALRDKSGLLIRADDGDAGSGPVSFCRKVSLKSQSLATPDADPTGAAGEGRLFGRVR
ncbi:hypothetical protein EVAR_81943_1 [Eumeta japonica]|uniref:DUF7042 domain-containing protein n=1 Tax=Eumeta variegata TaxID=151549 RepID=A0A4C1ZHP0_EUMVA|nr:hypothetical protein EVAR_81943_1 [Eumeta japonica]